MSPSAASATSAPGSPAVTAPSEAVTDPFAPDTPAVGEGPFEGAIPRPAPGGTGAGVIPPDLAEFYDQQLDWQSCRPVQRQPRPGRVLRGPRSGVRQPDRPARLRRPRRADGQHGGHPSARHRCRPGRVAADQPGRTRASRGWTTSPRSSTQGSAAALRESLDLVGFDTRGLGASRPRVECQTDAEKDAARAANHRTTTPPGIAAADRGRRPTMSPPAWPTPAPRPESTEPRSWSPWAPRPRCKRHGRAALGPRRRGADLPGLLLRHPARVGATPTSSRRTCGPWCWTVRSTPTPTPTRRSIDQNAGFQGTFEAFAAWCAQQQSCPLAADPVQATADYQELVRPLLDAPLELPGRPGAHLRRRDHRHRSGAVQPTRTGRRCARHCSSWPTATAYLLMVLADQYLQPQFARATTRRRRTSSPRSAASTPPASRHGPAAVALREEARGRRPVPRQRRPGGGRRDLCELLAGRA